MLPALTAAFNTVGAIAKEPKKTRGKTEREGGEMQRAYERAREQEAPQLRSKRSGR